MQKIYVQVWLEQPKQVREYLARIFGLVSTGIKEIRDQTIVSDGFTNYDLEGITTEKMMEYLGIEEFGRTFSELWELTLKRVNKDLNPVVISLGGIQPLSTKFCDSCDSKGVRHKKTCPKFK